MLHFVVFLHVPPPFFYFILFSKLYLLAEKSSSIYVLTKHKITHLAAANIPLQCNIPKPVDLWTFHTLSVFDMLDINMLLCASTWFWLHSCHTYFGFGYCQCHHTFHIHCQLIHSQLNFFSVTDPRVPTSMFCDKNINIFNRSNLNLQIRKV